MASAAFEKERNKDSAIRNDAVKIILPAFGDLPQKTLRFGTSKFHLDDELYEDKLNDSPSDRSKRGFAQDFAEFNINDVESKIYDSIKPYEEVIEDSEVIIYETYYTENDLHESEIYHNGSLESFSFSESDNTLRFSSIGDMTKPGYPVGGRILTQRYCAATFNVNGLKSPLLDPCGWQPAQGGNPVFCTHRLKGVDGCEDHNNSHRIVAVEGLTAADVQIVAGGGLGGGGWDYGGNPCFTARTLVWMADGSFRQIRNVKKNDLVWSFTPTGEIVRAKVRRSFRHPVAPVLVLDFGKNRFVETTDEHLFLIGNDRFKPASELEIGETVRVSFDAVWYDLTLRRTEKLKRSRPVYNFHVDRWETYFVVVNRIKIAVHNYKLPDIY